MPTSGSFLSITVIIFLLPFNTYAQDSLAAVPVDSVINKDITISYSVEIKSGKSNTGIEETYSGGVKTVFISGGKARVRLVSLMRMQSTFILPPGSAHYAAIVKESGKSKYKSYLTPGEWKLYNNKYDSASCVLTNDSSVILDYPCRKAIVDLRDGRTMTVYYTDSIKNPLFQVAEPAFKCIPGTVLMCMFTHKRGTVMYTATNINRAPVSGEVFQIPSKGIITRKPSFSKSGNYSENNLIESEISE